MIKVKEDDAAPAKWEQQVLALRVALGAEDEKAPWTRRALLCGVPASRRVLETIDVAWMHICKAADVPYDTKDPSVRCGKFVNYSQMPARKAWPHIRTFTTSDLYYSFEHDRQIMAGEVLHALGHDAPCLQSLCEPDIQSLAGQGMCAGSLGVALYAIVLGVGSQFPDLWEV